MPENHRNKTLIEDAYREIKGMIFDQKLVPGQRLVYQDLGNILHMSQTPIINALNRLEQEGFVESENFRGFFVKPIDLQEVWDAFGVREALEVYAVKQAILVGDAVAMETLEEYRLEHEQYLPPQYTRKKFFLDSKFHIQMAAMANNRVLGYLLKRNFEHVYLRTRLDHYDPRRMMSSAADHRRLVERMKMKDTLGSIEIIQNHVQTARDHVIRCLSSEETGDEEYGYK
ncbi:MAG: GntR family transcriptional regulator [Deltaproteobacteria bacterium]|nr:GntR family transcriptional regulator [Deltaproteobacteria bacterium]